MLTSKQMQRLWSTGSDSLKVRKVITGSNAAAVTYYWKPKTRCKLLGAALTLLTNTGNGTAITISRTNIQDSDLQRGAIQISTDITASDIASSDLLSYTLPSSALTTTEFTPAANISDLFLTIDPDAASTDLTTYGNAVKILIADLGSSSEAMTGVLTLEYMPII